MSAKSINQISVSYKSSVKRNIEDIRMQLKNCEVYSEELLLQYQQIFSVSTSGVIERWKVGKKYTRTNFVLDAFSKYYPKEYLKLSISLDVMINLLDDLLDEKLSEDEKKVYVIELLRNLALYNYFITNRKLPEILGMYFNKLITLAVAEQYYLKNLSLSKENNTDNIVTDLKRLLLTRSMDIDPFVDIAMLSDKSVGSKKISRAARLFRGNNILKKDLDDIEYDIKNKQETAVTFLYKTKKSDFKSIILKTSELITTDLINIKISNKKENNKQSIINNFFSMTVNDSSYIKKLMEKY